MKNWLFTIFIVFLFCSFSYAGEIKHTIGGFYCSESKYYLKDVLNIPYSPKGRKEVDMMLKKRKISILRDHLKVEVMEVYPKEELIVIKYWGTDLIVWTVPWAVK